jgi:hypothetical protein
MSEDKSLKAELVITRKAYDTSKMQVRITAL